MSRSEIIRIGRLSIPFPWLLFVVAVIVGGGIVYLLMRSDRQARRRVFDIGSSLLVAYFLAWKLSPILTDPKMAIRTPLSLLYLPGGTLGVLVGFVAAAIVAVFSVVRTHQEMRGRTGRGLAVWAAVVIVCAGGGWLMLPTTASIRNTTGTAPSVTGFSPGDRAPSFDAVTLSGSRVKVASAENGEGTTTVVLNFWATWCPPCRAELPQMVAFARNLNKRHGRGGTEVRFYAVNLTSTEDRLDSGGGAPVGDKISQFLSSVGASDLRPYVLLDGDGTIAQKYDVTSVPTTVIIRDGRVFAVHPGVVTTDWLRSVTGM